MPKIVLLGWLAVALTLCCNVDSVRSESMTVVDALGRSVTLSLPIRRIVTLNVDSLEVIRALQAEDLLVGVDSGIAREPEFWGDLAARPRVGDWRAPNLEAIVRLNPDLVIAYGRYPGQEFDRKMTALGIKVLRLDLYKIDTLGREVRVLGQVLDRQSRAARLCDWFRRHLGIIREKLAPIPISERPVVYVESYSDYRAAGPGSGADEMCALAGGRNIAAGLAIPYPQVSPEWVVSQNPVVIIKADSSGRGYMLKNSSSLNRRRAAIMRRRGWQHIAAVAAGNVHVVDGAIWSGPRAVVGIAWMARWFYPKLFRNLDPEKWHKTYLQNFQGMAYRGVYVSDAINKGAR